MSDDARTGRAHSLARIDPVLGDSTRFAAVPAERQPDVPLAMQVMDELGLRYVSEWESRVGTDFYHHAAQDGTPIDITGWDLLVRAHLLVRTAIAIEDDTLVLGPIENGRLSASWAGDSSSFAIDEVLARVDSAGALMAPRPGPQLPRDALRLDAELEGLRVRILFETLGGSVRDSVLEINAAMADVLIDRR